MSEKLIYPIGFDLDAAVSAAGELWDKKYASKLERYLAKRPINITLNYGNIDDVKRRLSELKLEPITPETKSAIRELAKELETLAKALEQVQKYSTGRVAASPDAVRAARIQELEAKRQVQLEKAAEAAAKAAKKELELAQAREKSANSAVKAAKNVNKLTKAYENQSSYLERLVQRMAATWSLHRIGEFLTSIRDVTAEFELQRVSLGAIIRDQTRANELFSEIKSFALKSPVSILDLTKYTKQLAAYKIGIDELFETTKRLTDVSVGLGVSMDRVVLAYGQTRATGYLRASEIRQFTEMGVPIVEELAAKLSEMNGELVTAAKVMDMVSKRAISFELVKDVFEDMTSAGGMFYNMQEKQGNTLYGMWAKLGDAASVMYEQIGNTDAVNEGMRSAIEALTEFMRNWKATAAAMAVGVGALGALFGTVKGVMWIIAAQANLKKATEAATVATKNRVAAQERLNAALAKGAAAEAESAALALQSAYAQEKAAKKAQRAAGIGMRIGKGLLKTAGGMAALTVVISLVEKLMSRVYEMVAAEEAATRLKNTLAEIKSKGYANMTAEANNFKALANAAVNAADGTKQQRDALDELKRTYGNIIPEQDLTIEKLREMSGGYESLTRAIKENIAQQAKQQSINTITEEYGPKLKKAKKELTDYLKSVVGGGTGQKIFGERQAERVADNFEKNLDAGMKYAQAMREALTLEGEEFARYTTGLVKNANRPVRQFAAIQNGLKKDIASVSSEFEDAAGELGKYQKAWQDMQEFNENMTIKAPKGTFAYSQEQKNEQIKNLRAFLQTVLGDAWSDSFANIQTSVGEDADKMSELFWLRIEASVDSPAQKNAVEKAKRAYYEIIPQSETVRIWRDKAQEIAKAQDFAMDKARKFLIGDTQSLKDYRKGLEDEMKEIINRLLEYQTNKRLLLAVGKDTTEQDNLIEVVEKEKKYIEALLAMLPSFPSSRDGRQSDPRLGILQEIVSTLKQVNKEYDELAKKEGATKALEDTQEKYANTFKYLQSLATKYKFKLPEFGVPTDAQSLTKYLDAIKEVMAKLPKSDKAVLSLETDIADIKMDASQKKIENQLKSLADRISRTKTAKEFYDKILSQTGDVEMAAKLAINVYGADGKDLNQQVREQVEKLIEPTSATIDYAVFNADSSLNAKKLREYAEAQKDALGGIKSEAYQALIKLADNADKDFAKTIEGWLKSIEKVKTYSDKMLDLANKTNEVIAEINRREANGDLGEDEAEMFRAGLREKQAKEEAKLMYEAFKDSPMYVQIFDDLDNASTRMLDNMKSRLESMRDNWKNLDPTQLKELQSRLNEIDEQLAKRNPFKELIGSIREYRHMGGIKGEKGANQTLINTAKAADEARRKYEEILHKDGATKEEIAKAKDELDEAMSNEEAAQKAVENWKKVKDMIGLSANELFQMFNWAGDIAGAIADISEAMGADEEDVQYWNDIASALGEVAGGVQDIVQSAMSGDIVGIISSVLTAVPKMFVGFVNLFSAGRIRDANKEIRSQEAILERLEYSYSRLQKAAEKLFGSDYISNFNRQMSLLEAKAEAYRKQAEAEESKGKKADDEKSKEYRQSARDTLDEIADMEEEMRSHFTGSTRSDAAREFAQSWLEAKATFASTTDAMRSKYSDMIKNMIVEGAAARVIENALAPMWDSMDRLLDKGDVNGAIDALVGGMDTFMTTADRGMNVLYESLLKRGIDIRELLGDNESDLKGISRDIASASEESINGLATGINTQNYYIAQQLEEVRAIRAMLRGEENVTAPVVSGVDRTALQTEALDHLGAIERHTAETLAECRKIATDIHRVVVPKGAKSQYGVQVYLRE